MEDTRKLKATELFNHLFQACNILRGPINQDEFKAYVIPILFLKRISDCYDEETAAAEAKYGADVSLYSEEELHPFRMPDGCHWCDIRTKSEDLGKAIVDAKAEVERKNSESYLTAEHIAKIAAAYHEGADVPGFAKMAGRSEIEQRNWSLNIALYVGETSQRREVEEQSFAELWTEYRETAERAALAYEKL